MDSKQQDETLDHFNKNAQDWKEKGQVDAPDKVNIIKQRNDYVLKVIKGREKTETALDVGCGTGDLVFDMAKLHIQATGVDFAKEMIDIAQDQAKKANINAHFQTCSIFDYQAEANTFDVISANGFLEYISYKELNHLLELSQKWLKPGGSLVLGSRNRLFNIFSLNQFTQEEIDNGSIHALLSEAIYLANTKNIDGLADFPAAPLQKEATVHMETNGIKVDTRYQFTPAQLASMVQKKGFQTIEIYPAHIHGVNPTFKAANPSIHGQIANFLQQYADNALGLVPQASSFMIHAKKV